MPKCFRRAFGAAEAAPPHDDPDDRFDLATLYAIPELGIKGIVLDQGWNQLERPGRILVSQLNSITGRNVSAVIGLAAPLKSPDDKALDQPAEFHRGVELIVFIDSTPPDAILQLQ